MTAANHRRARLVWVIAAGATLAVSVGGLWWPWLNVYVAPRGAWIWCVVGAAFHHGWLRAHGHRDDVAVMQARAELAAVGPVVEAAVAYVTAEPVWPDGWPWPELEDAVHAYIGAGPRP